MEQLLLLKLPFKSTNVQFIVLLWKVERELLLNQSNNYIQLWIIL